MTLMRSGARAYARKIFEETLAFSKDPAGGVSREGYGPVEQKAHDYLRSAGEALGLEITTDPAGNLFMTYPGRDRSLPAYMTGSHADSVPQGGHFDGLAGIAAGLAAIWWMKHEGAVPLRDTTLAVFRMEESSWFGKAYVGSLALTGGLKAKDLALKHRTRDETLGEAISRAGFDPARLVAGAPLIDLKKIAAFTELHIEQGPSLDSDDKARVGIVTGIRGNVRHKAVRCLGVTGHSGAVDKIYRHDAVMALACLLGRIDTQWDAFLSRGGDLVFTAGVVKTAASSAISVIPGEVSFTVDIRSLKTDTLERFHNVLTAEAGAVGAERGVTFTFDPVIRSAPASLDKSLTAHLAEAARQAGIAFKFLPSGAGHDCAVLSNAGVPSSMIFIANQNGSHNPREAMELDDFMLGAEVLFTSITTFDK